MNEWKRASLIELLTENNEMLRMFYRMLNSPNKLTSIISPIIIPYLALLAEGNSSLIGGAEEYPEINGQSYKKIIEKTRLRAKIYSQDRLTRSIKHIEANTKAINHDLTYDYNIFQIIRASIVGQKTLGLNVYKGTPIFSNYLGYSYLSEFFEIDDHARTDKSLLRGKDISLFAQYSSNYILQVVTGANKIFNTATTNDGNPLDINLGDLEIDDYLITPKEKQTFFANKDMDLSVSIFLLDILCTINFVRVLLPKMIDANSSLYFRIKLITYVSAVESIDKLSKGFNRQTNSELHTSEIASIIERKREIITKSIRNNLFHFDIPNTDIPQDKLNGSGILFTLIEHLSNMPLPQYDSTVNSEFEKIVQLINKWIF